MNTGALFLVSNEVGNLLHRLDETVAHEVMLHDDAFVNSIKEIYDVPYMENINSDIMVFRTEREVEWFFSVLRLNNLKLKDKEKKCQDLLKKMKKNDCCLIYHR